MKNSREYMELKKSLGNGLRSPLQVNKLFEADCEILKLSSKNYLATSIDSISEEIDLGLYKEVETWAWMTVMSSVSDLAASGTSPLGLTIAAQWKYGTENEVHQLFYKSVNLACKKANVPFLGGDTGNGVSHAFTSSIIGQSTRAPLMRTGACEGDLLVLAHQKKTGIGPALAYRFLLNGKPEILPENLFRPMPSWELAASIAPYAHAAIDTSDGVATSVYIMSELNGLGVELIWDDKVNDPSARLAMNDLDLSPLFLWLGDHGDFQTLFAVPEKHLSKLPLSNQLSVIGKFTKKAKNNYRIQYNKQNIELPIEAITQCPRDLESYSKLVKDTQKYLAPYK
ncbi:MAG: AIR synthase related protein [Bacteriovorax sp.]|jgi:thiamine-monophosphate kinase